MNGLRNKKSIALIVSLILLLTMTVGSTVAYVVTEAPSLMNLFIPGFESTGNLVLEKQVEHPFDTGYKVPDDLSFVFDLSFGQNYANKTVLSTAGQLTCDEQGNISVSLKPGASVEFQDILSGTSVTVSERQDHEGFTTSEVSKNVTIGRVNDTYVSFINVYHPESATSILSVTGVKTIFGREWMDGDTFTFRLDVKNHGKDGEWTYLGEKTICYDETNGEYNRFDLSDLIPSFESAGTYIFKLSEVSGTLAGMTSEDKTFEVIVSDLDMNGYLDISDVRMDGQSLAINEGQYVFDVNIINEYLSNGSDEVVIEIHKELEDLSGQNMTPAGFTFSLYDMEGVRVASSSATSSTGETSIRLVYDANDAGNEYEYVLKEDVGSVYGMQYDDQEIHLLVSVVDNYDGTVSAYIYEEKICEEIVLESANTEEPAVTPETSAEPANTEESAATPETMVEPEPHAWTVCRIPDDAADRYSVSFKNTYDPEDAQIVLSGDKDLIGRSLDASEFKFDLMYEGIVVETVSHSEDGHFVFSPLYFSRAGIFEYVVRENLEKLPGGVEPDYNEFTIAVTVRDNQGILEASYEVLDKNLNEAELKFVNHYQPDKASVDLMGIKSLDGKDIEPEEFIFELYETDESYVMSAVKESVYNNNEGEFKFSTLEFDREGTFYYAMKENSSKSPVNGVTYDNSEYQIEIKIKDDRKGALHADVQIVHVKGAEKEGVSEFVFNNSYDAKDAVVTLTGLKKLSGASIHEGMFSFYLYETDETFGYDPASEPLKKTTNDPYGNFAFDSLTFDEEKTAYYVIIESHVHQLERVEYDDRVYEITVVVEDYDGNLEAQITGAENVVFENTFVPKPNDLEIQFIAHKNIRNTGTQIIGPEGFQFLLEQKHSDNKSIVKSDEQGNAIFKLNYSEEDVGNIFEYKLSEINDGIEGVTYSAEAYDISVEIVLENGGLKAMMKLEGEEIEEVICEFENIYHQVIETTPQPEKPANTGDSSHVLLYASFAVVSLIMMVLIAVLKTSKRKNS